MPCPYFEPASVATDPRAAHARLPLIDEYDGVCHASQSPRSALGDWRFAGCNQGRHQDRCPRFPVAERAAIRRFTVQSKTETTLSVLVCEELDHVPVRWRPVRYSVVNKEILDPCFNPCETAQICAFCASYLRRFAA